MTTQFIVHFYQAVQENNLAEITVSYESGWNRLTEKYYAKTEWPEAELIAPLVNDGTAVIPFLPLAIYLTVLPRPYFLDFVSGTVLPTCLLPATTEP